VITPGACPGGGVWRALRPRRPSRVTGQSAAGHHPTEFRSEMGGRPSGTTLKRKPGTRESYFSYVDMYPGLWRNVLTGIGVLPPDWVCIIYGRLHRTATAVTARGGPMGTSEF